MSSSSISDVSASIGARDLEFRGQGADLTDERRALGRSLETLRVLAQIPRAAGADNVTAKLGDELRNREQGEHAAGHWRTPYLRNSLNPNSRCCAKSNVFT